MNVLHIWDVCGNSQYITEKLTKLGHKSKVITRTEYSRKNLSKYYLRVIINLLSFRADIVHINSWDKGIILAKIFSPKSKIIMHYHGSDIIDRVVPLRVQLLANKICFSTKNLIDSCASYDQCLLPVIIPEMFYYRGCREEGTTLVLDQDNRTIPYELMPIILSHYEYYRDKKRRPNITSSEVLSKTGMEAIQCGTKVITDSGEIVESFPMTKLRDYFIIYNELIYHPVRDLFDALNDFYWKIWNAVNEERP